MFGTQPVQRFVLDNVSWEEYGKFLEAIGENHVRVTYDRGTHRIHVVRSRSMKCTKCSSGRLFDVLMDGTGHSHEGVRFDDLSPPGRRRAALSRTNVITSAARRPCSQLVDVQTWRSIRRPTWLSRWTLRAAVLNRMDVYAGLRIPEVWRFDGEALEVHRLRSDGGYEVLSQSVELPFLPVDEVPELIQQSMRCQEDRALMRGLREWVRTSRCPAKQASDESQGDQLGE